MLHQLTTSFIARLRAQDQAAWFDLWETFGPVLRIQLAKWGKGRIGPETVQDLSQETLAALSDSIDKYDPRKGARFSTWLLASGKEFTALTLPDCRKLGVFYTVKAASDAISAAHGGAHA